MTLYTAILNYIEKEIPRVLEEAGKRNKFIKSQLESSTKDMIATEFAKYRILVDEAYEHKDKKITDDVLDYIIKKVGKIEELHFSVTITTPNILSARKEFFKSYIEFYQQIFKQENNTCSLEEAIRLQFKTKEAYKKAIEPIFQSEKKIECMINKSQPAFTEMNSALFEASKFVTDKKADEIFSN